MVGSSAARIGYSRSYNTIACDRSTDARIDQIRCNGIRARIGDQGIADQIRVYSERATDLYATGVHRSI